MKLLHGASGDRSLAPSLCCLLFLPFQAVTRLLGRKRELSESRDVQLERRPFWRDLRWQSNPTTSTSPANLLEVASQDWLSFLQQVDGRFSTVATRWDENAGLRRDAIGSQVIDALEAQEIKEIGIEED